MRVRFRLSRNAETKTKEDRTAAYKHVDKQTFILVFQDTAQLNFCCLHNYTWIYIYFIPCIEVENILIEFFKWPFITTQSVLLFYFMSFPIIS